MSLNCIAFLRGFTSTAVSACMHGPSLFLQDAPGIVPRLNASVEQPLGPHDVEQSPLCSAFRAPGAKTVAIVGNGPLDSAQRRDIDACTLVVRCGTTSRNTIISAPQM